MESITLAFNPGQTVITAHLDALINDPQDEMEKAKRHNEVVSALRSYLVCDWGDTHPEDCPLNDASVRAEQAGDEDNQTRLVAKYCLSFCDIFIITEWDRSYTTIMEVSDY